jgi:hypothetical protein
MADEPGGAERSRGEELEDASLLAEAPGVGADQALLVLEQVVELEAGRAAAGGVGEENRGAARTQGADRGRGERGAADAVEDGVDRERGEPRGVGREGGVGAELERQRPPVVARIDDRDFAAGRDGAHHEEMEEPHAAAAEDQRPGLPRERERGVEPRALDATEHARRRLEPEGVELAEPRRQRVRRAGGGRGVDPDLFGEPARLEAVDPELGALGLRPGEAEAARSAGQVVRHHDARSDGEARAAARDDLAHHLVPEHRPERHRPAGELPEVGAAEAAGEGAEDDLAVAGKGGRALFEGRRAPLLDRRDAHGAGIIALMERRDNRRFARRVEVRFWRRGDPQAHSAFTTNISRTGMFLGTSLALVPGERLRLELLDDENGFAVEGQVARAHRVSVALRQVAQPGVGVQFLMPEQLIESFLPMHGRADQPGSAAQSPAAAASFLAGAVGAASAAGAPPAASAARAGEAPPSVDPDVKIVTVRFAEPSAFLSTFHRDIQFGGLFVSSDTPAELNEVIWIDVALPLADVALRPFAARVVQRFEPEAAVGGGRNVLSGMAVQFLEPERVVAELRPLIARLRS